MAYVLTVRWTGRQRLPRVSLVFRVPGHGEAALDAYLCPADECSSHTTCRCPFDQTTCNFATDLVNTQGLSGQQECLLTSAGTLSADIYVYGNTDIETITLSRIESVGSLVIVDCPNLRNISAPDAITAGNITVESCPSLESMRLPTLSNAGFMRIVACPVLRLLDVVRIETIGGGLTIDGCESLAAVIVPALEAVGGSVAISGVRGMASCRFDKLAEVAGSFSIAGAPPSAITTLPCSARLKQWESAAVGTVEYSTGVSITCHGESSVAQISATKSCDVCDVCVQCDNDESTPVLLPGFVQFVGIATTDAPGGTTTTNVFECQNKLGCHGVNSTAGGGRR